MIAVICRGALGNMAPKRLHKDAPKSQILVVVCGKRCKKKATNNNNTIQISVVICKATLGQMVPKRFQTKGRLETWFQDCSKRRARNRRY